ncbi:MAG: hypothetical protein RMM53_14030, partial [Bacteroidia bacterium]|nr:hypothetical protein [Bacteroidia bacterium]
METRLFDAYEYLSPEEADAKVETLMGEYRRLAEDANDDDALRLISDLMTGLAFVRNLDELARVMPDAYRRVEKRMADNPED